MSCGLYLASVDDELFEFYVIYDKIQLSGPKVRNINVYGTALNRTDLERSFCFRTVTEYISVLSVVGLRVVLIFY